mmetsp:Transcript_34679/g.69046  ORF Transcript_34679/g.69046 Transcript_34679/m.69046 type:complete len:326 (-) Transcript_34679:527-1504(-)
MCICLPCVYVDLPVPHRPPQPAEEGLWRRAIWRRKGCGRVELPPPTRHTPLTGARRRARSSHLERHIHLKHRAHISSADARCSAAASTRTRRCTSRTGSLVVAMRLGICERSQSNLSLDVRPVLLSSAGERTRLARATLLLNSEGLSDCPKPTKTPHMPSEGAPRPMISKSCRKWISSARSMRTAGDPPSSSSAPSSCGYMAPAYASNRRSRDSSTAFSVLVVCPSMLSSSERIDDIAPSLPSIAAFSLFVFSRSAAACSACTLAAATSSSNFLTWPKYLSWRAAAAASFSLLLLSSVCRSAVRCFRVRILRSTSSAASAAARTR